MSTPTLGASGGTDAAQGHDDKCADRGEAGADDADVDLDGGPDGDFLLHPRGVGGVDVVGDEGFETETAHDCDARRVSG